MAAHRPSGVALATDLYQFTMGAAYLELGLEGRATFSLFVRRLPSARGGLVCAGVEEALSRLTSLTLDEESTSALVRTGHLDQALAERLSAVRFTGDVWAMREGRAFFPDEPVLEVDAPIVEAQLVESTLLNAVHYATVVASKAVRCTAAARGRDVIEFGLRRSPGIEASLTAARACWLAGFAATSNVLAASTFGMAAAGTVAHSFVEIFEHELDSFRASARTARGPLTLLVDTYDTVRGVSRAIEVARELEARGARLDAVRLDSGDLGALSREARGMLDDAGMGHVAIVASGGLDEYAIDRLERSGAPIDRYAVGTRVGMSADAPVLDMAYKLVSYEGRPRLKLSAGKETLVLPKQVYRRSDAAGRYVEDVITLRDEPAPGADWEPLLEPVIRGGDVVRARSLDASRAFCREEMARFPAALFLPGERADHPVGRSPALAQRQAEAVAELRAREGR